MGLAVCRKGYDALPLEKRTAAVSFLRRYFSTYVRDQIRSVIAVDPEGWFASYHMFWGMSVRNALRKSGFGEGFFPIGNLDDIYVELIEDAVKEDQCPTSLNPTGR